jgi:DNA-binding NtrC family response regulator
MSDTDRDILIVDDEPAICNLLARLIRKEGWCAEVAHSGLSALDAIHKAPPDLLLLDYRLPDMTGQDVMREARLILPELPVVVITAYASVQTAVDSMRAGAVDFLAKPFDHRKLLSIIHSTLAGQEASLSPPAAHRLTTGGEIHSGLQDSMGPSRVIRELAQQVERVAASNFNVLLVGETGTGKELVSQAIHRSSSRRKGPFVPVDCGALPDQLLESELFGHEKGAFTGAVSLPAPSAASRASSNWRTVAPCSWTRFPIFPGQRKASCCGRFRSVSFTALAVRNRSASTSA